MRRADDQRLWFDKADGKTMYGVFPDQRFYSSEFLETYAGEAADVRELVDILAVYSEWCRLNYLERRAGRDQIPLPPTLRGLRFAPPTGDIEEEDDEPEISDTTWGN